MSSSDPKSVAKLVKAIVKSIRSTCDKKGVDPSLVLEELKKPAPTPRAKKAETLANAWVTECMAFPKQLFHT
jgi:hypothetical protein